MLDTLDLKAHNGIMNLEEFRIALMDALNFEASAIEEERKKMNQFKQAYLSYEDLNRRTAEREARIERLFALVNSNNEKGISTAWNSRSVFPGARISQSTLRNSEKNCLSGKY